MPITSYIVDQAFPNELGVQMKPGQNWPGPIPYNGAVYRVVVKENLYEPNNNEISTIAVYKTTDGGITSTELDAAGEIFVRFQGNAYNDAIAYYPPEGGDTIYCAYQEPSENELRLIQFDLASETWGSPVTGGPVSIDSQQSGTLSLVVRTTGEWIVFYKGGGINYVSYNVGWGSPVFLQSGSNFTSLLTCGRDASDNVIFYGQGSATFPGPIQARALSSSNVLGAVVSVGLTFIVNQDNCCPPVYVADANQMTLAIAELGGVNSAPGGVIHCVKSAPNATGFTVEEIQGTYTTNFDNGDGPPSPYNVSPLQGEQGQGWPRLALSPDGETLYCYYNVNDNSVDGINDNAIIKKTQVVGETTWDAGTTIFDTNVDTMVPDVHDYFGVESPSPCPAYRMAITITSDGTQLISYGTIARQPEEAPDIIVDDFGNAQFYFEIQPEGPEIFVFDPVVTVTDIATIPHVPSSADSATHTICVINTATAGALTDTPYIVRRYAFNHEPMPPDTIYMTPWQDFGYQFQKIARNLLLDIDTAGIPAVVTLQTDGQTQQSFTVTTTSNDRNRVFATNSDLEGKLWRLTLTPGTNGKAQLFSASLDFVPDVNIVTYMDTYEQELGYDSWKFIKRAWLEYKGGPINVVFIVDQGLTFYQITLPYHAVRDMDQFYLPAAAGNVLNKSKIYRIQVTGVDGSGFRLYANSALEWYAFSADEFGSFQIATINPEMQERVGQMIQGKWSL